MWNGSVKVLWRRGARRIHSIDTRAPYRFDTKGMVEHQRATGHGSCNSARFGDDASLGGDCLII